MKKILFVLTALLLLIPGCGSNHDSPEKSPAAIPEEVEEEPDDDSIFSKIQSFESMNGDWALATVDKKLMTDNDLIDYYFSHIKDSGYKWFVLDFQNGTGYMFIESKNAFEYIYQHEDDWSLSDMNKVIGSGFVYKDRVEYSPADEPAYDGMSFEESVDTLITLLRESISDDFEKNYNIEYDADYNAVVILVWYDGLATEVGTAIMNDDAYYSKTWQEVIDTSVALNKQSMTAAKQLELNVDIIVNVLSDLNLNNTLLTVYNGVVTYNILDE